MLLSWLTRRRDRERLAEKIASVCQQKVCDRSDEAIVTLPIAQARGYVRARATAVVRREVDRAVADGEYRGDRQPVVDLATARIVREAIARRTQDAGSSERSTRRAA